MRYSIFDYRFLRKDGKFEVKNWKAISEKLKEKRMQDHVALTRKAKQDRMQNTESSKLAATANLRKADTRFFIVMRMGAVLKKQC